MFWKEFSVCHADVNPVICEGTGKMASEHHARDLAICDSGTHGVGK